MKNLSVAIILAFVPLTTVSASDTVPPASIHLELAKDTLALVEPTLLTVEIANNTQRELALDNSSMFTLHEAPYRFSLTLITPDGQKWMYDRLGTLHIDYPPDAPIYFILPPGKKTSDYMFLWWTCFLPKDCKVALENLPPGKYKVFATYRLPKQKELEKMVLHSDTFEFVFLPPKEEHLPSLVEMDSLWLYLYGGAGPALSRDARERFERIRNSSTPYSEAAHARLVRFNRNLDSFTVAKAEFDKLYPTSPFASVLLEAQFTRATLPSVSVSKGEVDSILEAWRDSAPTNFDVLIRTHELKTATSEEIK